MLWVFLASSWMVGSAAAVTVEECRARYPRDEGWLSTDTGRLDLRNRRKYRRLAKVVWQSEHETLAQLGVGLEALTLPAAACVASGRTDLGDFNGFLDVLNLVPDGPWFWVGWGYDEDARCVLVHATTGRIETAIPEEGWFPYCYGADFRPEPSIRLRVQPQSSEPDA